MVTGGAPPTRVVVGCGDGSGAGCGCTGPVGSGLDGGGTAGDVVGDGCPGALVVGVGPRGGLGAAVVGDGAGAVKHVPAAVHPVYGVVY